jgi:uncharacterized BrkB/YihY/UPF0761 family membrane protein
LHRLSEQAPRVGVTNFLRLAVFMIYTFLSSVFIALFFVVGSMSLYCCLENSQKLLPFEWLFYKHVIVLAIIAFLCFILACVFGSQIPACYA